MLNLNSSLTTDFNSVSVYLNGLQDQSDPLLADKKKTASETV